MSNLRATLWLGRHETPYSGLWVYIESVLPLLCKALEDRGVSVVVVGAGSEATRIRLEELSQSQEGGRFVVTWLSDPFGSRYLGNIRDAFFVKAQNGEEGLFHGMSNTLPLMGIRGRAFVTIHDLLQAFPVLPVTNLRVTLRTLFYRWYLRFILKNRSDFIITGHDKTRLELEERYGLGEKTVVVYPPLRPVFCKPLTEEEMKTSSSRKGESPYLLAFVSSDPRKNFERVLTAFEALEESALRLKVVLGQLSMKDEVRKLITKSSKRAQVDLEVGASPEELRSFFVEAMATLFPSLGEGFGYPIYESLSQGTPVLTSEELFISGLDRAKALVVGCDPTDQSSINEGVGAVLSIRTTPSERQAVSCEVQEYLGPKKCVERLIECYFNVANSG